LVSQIDVTMNIYGHVVPAMQHEAANEIDAALVDARGVVQSALAHIEHLRDWEIISFDADR
jgi:extradiol dioxygenase family protein